MKQTLNMATQKNDLLKNLQENSAKIKDVWLELPKYKFFHSPVADDKPDRRFIGRKKIQKKIKTILENSETRSGAYLITGFRGMGKTSLIRKVVGDLNREFNQNKNSKSILCNEPSKVYRTIAVIAFYSLVYCFFIYCILFIKLGFFIWNLKILTISFFGFIILLSIILLILEKINDGNIKKGENKKKDKEKDKNKKKEKNKIGKYKLLELSLSQEDVNEYDILKLISKELLFIWDKLSCKKDLKKGLYIFWYLPIELFTYLFQLNKIFNFKKYEFHKEYELINEKLQKLNYRISAKVDKEKQLNPQIGFVAKGLARIALLGSQSRKQISYPFANVKEIEIELIEILKDINKLRDLNEETKKQIPQFVFVIDELDKIDPSYNVSISDREQGNVLNNRDDISSKRTQERQEDITKLLANFKSFLNVAMAKFFFIGGRELYDASLADIADRDSFYSSIFHEVIYVNSFLKDKIEHRSGITRMTEAYLMKLLIPKEYAQKKWEESKEYDDTIREDDYNSHLDKYLNLKLYHKVLEEKLIGKSEEAIDKIIFLLQNFIVYLNYRSNGTPKKLTALIEYFITQQNTKKTGELEDINTAVVVNSTDESNEKNYLKFNYNQQYEIFFTSSIYRPFLNIQTRYLKAYGDKILFSNAFILDHILKFHAFGFSWRNLELIPEIILVNKEPNLRIFIEGMINFLSLRYIRTTINGIPEFQFQYRFYSELKFLSKISDLSSAAFNFTLDESLQIKRHYKKKLTELKTSYEPLLGSNDENKFIHSVSFVETILGDLHFYDQEYDDAIIYYTNSIQFLRKKNQLNLSRHQAILLFKNRLKLGLTLEKIRAYDSAFSVYHGIILDLPDQFDRLIDPKKESDFRGLQLFGKAHLAWLGVVEKQRFNGFSLQNLKFVESRFFDLIGSSKKIDNHNYDFRNLDNDLERITLLESDFYQNIGSILYYKNVDYFSSGKNGDEINSANYYYKALKKLVNFLVNYANLNKWEISFYNHYCGTLCDQNIFLIATSILRSNDNQFRNDSYEKIIGNLFSKLGDNVLTSIGSDSLLDSPLDKDVIDFYSSFNPYRENIKKIINWLYKNKKLNNYTNQKKCRFRHKELDINVVLIFVLISAHFYNYSGSAYKAIQQLKKALYILKDYALILQTKRKKFELDSEQKESENLDKHIKIFIETLKGKTVSIAEQALYISGLSYSISNRPQLLKYREILDIDYNRKDNTKRLYSSLSNSADVKEIILLTEEIKLKLNVLGSNNEPFNCSLPFINPYGIVTDRFTRMLELKFKCELNHYLIKHVLKLEDLFTAYPDFKPKDFLTKYNEKLKFFEDDSANRKKKIDFINDHYKYSITDIDNTINNIRVNEFIKFIINESIFALFEVIKTLEIYGHNYFASYTYLANAHYKLANWTEALVNMEKVTYGLKVSIVKSQSQKNEEDKSSNFADHKNEYETELRQLLGTDSIYHLEAHYHNEVAIEYYYSALKLHHEGDTYKKQFQNMFFLEDHFNENYIHFCAASERFRLGLVRDRIEKLKKKVRRSLVFKYENYFKN